MTVIAVLTTNDESSLRRAHGRVPDLRALAPDAHADPGLVDGSLLEHDRAGAESASLAVEYDHDGEVGSGGRSRCGTSLD
jgi:hypothetical protein